MAELLSSKVVVVEEEPSVRGIPSVSTSVAGMVGVTERGPVGVPVLCQSFEEFARVFGGYLRESDLPNAVAGFFENGGATLWVVRTCHYADPTDASTALARTAMIRGAVYDGDPDLSVEPARMESLPAPFAVAEGTGFALSVNGAHRREVVFSDGGAWSPLTLPGPFAVDDGATLVIEVGGVEHTLVIDAGAVADLRRVLPGELVTLLGTIPGLAASADASGRVSVRPSDTLEPSTVALVGGSARMALGAGPARRLASWPVDVREPLTAAHLAELLTAFYPELEAEVTTSNTVAISTRLQGEFASIEAIEVLGSGMFFAPETYAQGGGGESGRAPARVTGFREPLLPNPDTELVLRVGAGPEQRLRFEAHPAELRATALEPITLTDGETLAIDVGGAEQLVTFAAADFADITAATWSEVRSVLERDLVDVSVQEEAGSLVVRTSNAGFRVGIAARGPAASTLGFPEATSWGTGNLPNLGRVMLADVVAALSVLQPSVIADRGPFGALRLRTLAEGSDAVLTVLPDSTAASWLGFLVGENRGWEYGLDWPDEVPVLLARSPGSWGNRLEVEVAPAASGDAQRFDMTIIEGGVFRERFTDLSTQPEDERYAPRIVDDERVGSSLVRFAALERFPAFEPPDEVLRAPLEGGEDGLEGLSDSDILGTDAARNGLRALDTIQDLSLVTVPGRTSAALQAALVAWCENVRDGEVFAVLDPPPGSSAMDIVGHVTSGGLLGLSEHGALYWPRIRVLNPARAVYGSAASVVVCPSGHIAGAFARNDASRPGGVYVPPAGTESGRLFGVVGFETDEVLEERKRDLVYPRRVNPLMTGPGLPRFIDGSRTLKGDGNFPFVAERRGVSFIARSLRLGLQFARHRNNTEALRAQVRRTITAFLLQQMRNGAFRSEEASKAFFVDVSDTLNPPSVIMAGQLIARIGLATNKPAEFIILRISQDTRALDAELAGL